MEIIHHKISLRSWIHTTIKHVLTPTSFAIDATVGNGYDTLFLSQYIREREHIYAFDIQIQAIHTTHSRLRQYNMLHTTKLFHIGHETMWHTLNLYTKGNPPRCSAILFNLGYLPHSDKQCITQAQTTCLGLAQALQLLALYGILSIHTYHGHPGGYEEYQQVLEWISHLSRKQYHVFALEQKNKLSHHEVVFFVQKISEE